MKKITLLVAGLLLSGTLAQASEKIVFSENNNRNYSAFADYRSAEPVVFTDRGIEFMVFLTGEMDFNTVPATTGGAYYRSGRPAASTGVVVEHDYKGRVRRVGNVYINYDFDGRVKRIGTIYMNYNSFALTKIGGMRFVYDRWGRVLRTSGNITNNTRGYAYQPYTGTRYESSNVYGNSNGSGYNGGSNSNEEYYYYRKDGSKVKMAEADIAQIKNDETLLKRDEVIKR